MKKWIMVLIVVAFMGLTFGTVNASNSPGPATNSGDGIPDGPGTGFPPMPGPQGN